MKPYVCLLIVFVSIQAFSQSGVYVREPVLKDGTKIKWTLTLNSNGTFLYHFFRDVSAISKGSAKENYYGKGTWVLEGNIITLFSKETDINEQYTVNLNQSKARYISKSPRDTSDKIVKTALRFYASNNIKGLELFKE